MWPVSTVFPDFFNEKAKEIWRAGFNDLAKELPFDGIWLDMNEVATFCNGDISDKSDMCVSNIKRTKQLAKAKTLDDFNKFLTGGAAPLKDHKLGANEQWYRSYPQDKLSTFNLPFVPNRDRNFDFKTMSLNATHPKSGLQ